MQKNRLKRRFFCQRWSECGDSNPGPPAPKAGALPTAQHPDMKLWDCPGGFSQITCATNCATPGYSFFCHYTTASGKNKDFSVCGHSCGQSRFYAAFGNRRKSRKCRCHKALRRFALPRPGYRHGTPKAGALPTALHPVIYCRLERPPHSIPYSAPVFKSFLHRRPQKVVGLQYILDN